MAEALVQALGPWTRRGFLLRGAAAVAAGGALAQTACSPKVSMPANLPHLGADFPVMHKLVETLLPIAAPSPLQPVADVPVLENLDAIFATIPSDIRGDLGKGLALFNYAAIVLGFNMRPFTALKHDAAVDYARRWEYGNEVQRSLMHALKQMVFLAYWQEPSTWPAIGYDGPVTAVHNIPSLGTAPLPESL